MCFLRIEKRVGCGSEGAAEKSKKQGGISAICPSAAGGGQESLFLHGI